MKIKPGAKPSFRLEMIRVRKAVDEVFSSYGYTCWLTSGMDGEHSAGSLHYAGYAEDFGAATEIPIEAWRNIEMDVTNLLGGLPYQVFAHGNPIHLHVEYDPREFQRYK
jgi:hypothetical protein